MDSKGRLLVGWYSALVEGEEQLKLNEPIVKLLTLSIILVWAGDLTTVPVVHSIASSGIVLGI